MVLMGVDEIIEREEEVKDFNLARGLSCIRANVPSFPQVSLPESGSKPIGA